jgi:GNAT superfamily N-acetyltransferase
MIRDLVRAAYAKWVSVIGREPRPMSADYAQAVANHQIELLHRGATLLGLIEMMPRDDHLWIENIAVRPESQGQGLGRLLLAQAERLAAELGQAELRLLTNADFAANVVLYERNGYRVTRREAFMGGTTLYMSKNLI